MCFLLIVFLLALFYILFGYFFIVYSLSGILGKVKVFNNEVFGVTVYVSAFNEADVIEERLINLIASNFPKEKLEIIVISDGSTDKTVEKVNDFILSNQGYDIKIHEFTDNMGKHVAQNYVAKNAKYDILIATDSETVFGKNFLYDITRPFSDKNVAVSGGRIVFRNLENNLGRYQNMYRSFENRLRISEDKISLLTKTDGCCTAYRKAIWEDIEEFEDIDQIIVLLAKSKNFIAAHVPSAIASEVANENSNQEVNQRSRMTRKALLSFSKRWSWSLFLRYPLFTLCFVSHKIMRFFIPFILIMLIFSFFGFALENSMLLKVLFATFLCGLTFYIGHKICGIKFISRVYNFIRNFYFSNIGYTKGVIGWIANDKNGKYLATKNF